MILRLHSLLAAPEGAASKLSLWPPKNQEVQFGAFIRPHSNLFYQKFLEKTTPRPAFAGRGRKTQKNRSGGAGRKKGVGKMNSRPALAAARKIFI
jgi:hypothetical protein